MKTYVHGIPVREWRVDRFWNNEHIVEMFDTEEEAREYAAGKEGNIFLLKEICDGMYDIVELIG